MYKTISIVTICLILMGSCSTISTLSRVKGKEMIYTTHDPAVRLQIYIDPVVQIGDTTQHYRQFKNFYAFPVGRFKIVVLAGCIAVAVTKGTVWYNPKGYMFLKSDKNCYDQMYHTVKECVDCPDSMHRIRIFVTDCINISLSQRPNKNPVEALVISACDSVYTKDISLSAGCKEQIQYIPQSCDSLTISLVYLNERELESEMIYLNQCFGDQKEVLVVVNKEKAFLYWWFYSVEGTVPLNKRRFTLCLYDCKHKEVRCYRFKRVAIKKAPPPRGYQ